jgi:hypothetical protein
MRQGSKKMAQKKVACGVDLQGAAVLLGTSHGSTRVPPGESHKQSTAQQSKGEKKPHAAVTVLC